MTKLILFSFICSFTLALPVGETMKTKVLKRHNANIITLARGSEDGIKQGEHIKLVNDDGFVARGLAVNVELNKSHWRTYRLVDPSGTRTGSDVKLTIMNEASIPPEMIEIAKNIKLKKVKKRKSRIAKKFVPKQHESSTDVFDALSMKDLKQDLKVIDANIYASPVQYSRVNSSKNITYGGSLGNIEGSKYRLQSNFFYTNNTQVDQYTGAGVSTSYLNATGSFTIENFYNDWSYTSLVDLKREKIGAIYPIKRRIQIGPFGMTLNLYRSSKVKFFDITYIPLVESQASQRYTTNATTGAIEVVDETSNKIRHGARLRLKYVSNERLTLMNTLFVKPNQSEFDDTDTSNSFNLSYNILSFFSLSYRNLYTWDKSRKTLNNLPSSNMIHTITAGINFQL